MVGLRRAPIRRSPAHRDRLCVSCGKSFVPSTTMQKACSNSCGVTAYHARQRATRQRACENCGCLFIPYPSALQRGSGKYCSRVCYMAKAATRPAMVTLACTQCGLPFRRTRAAVARTKRAFCSRMCATTWYSGPQAGMWRGGEAHWRGRTWTERLRESIRVRDGRRCRMCGKPEAENGARRLDIDHVIPFRWFEGDYERANEPANLVALCTVCHRKKARAERKYLEGDVLEMDRFRFAVALPWPLPGSLGNVKSTRAPGVPREGER